MSMLCDLYTAKVVFKCWPDFVVEYFLGPYTETICYQFLKFVISIQMLELIL